MGMTNEQYNSFLRAMLFNAKRATTVAEIIAIIESACDEDTIALVDQKIRKFRQKELEEKNQKK